MATNELTSINSLGSVEIGTIRANTNVSTADQISSYVRNVAEELSSQIDKKTEKITVSEVTDTKSQDDIINEISGVQNDMLIIKTPVGVDLSSSYPEDTVFSYTSYVHNGSEWTAMDGNYNAYNVFFDNNITATTNIGTINLGSDPSKEFLTKGKNLYTVLQSLLAEEKNPTRTLPATTFTVKTGGKSNTAEVGTTFTRPTGVFKVTSVGSYSYPPKNTDIYFDDVRLQYNTEPEVNSTNLGLNQVLEVTAQSGETMYKPSAISYTYKINAQHYIESPVTPKTNLGNDYPSAKIPEGSTSTVNLTVTFTGYQTGLFYGTTTEDITLDTITSDDIRKLSKTSNGNSTGSFTINVPVGAKSIIIASKGTGRTLAQALNTTVNAEMNTSFTKKEGVVVAGANNVSDTGSSDYVGTTYTVWMYTPATEYASTASISCIVS